MNQPYPENPIIIVDDEAQILMSYDTALRMAGFDNIVSCNDGRELISILGRQGGGVVMLDLMMPYTTGEKLLPIVNRKFPQIPVVVITGKDDTQTAVRCMKDGAFDFLTKPVDRERLVTTVRQALSFGELYRENKALGSRLLTGDIQYPEIFSNIFTNNAAMHGIFQYVEAIGTSEKPVLVTGEPGVGKELLAETIHRASARHGEFISFEANNINGDRFEEIFFKGESALLKKASSGTIFIDEIGELAMDAQDHLYSFLQDGNYTDQDNNNVHCDVRILVGSSRDLLKLRENGALRNDLYFQLGTHHIQVPPLRERLDDLKLLFEHFLEQICREMGKEKPKPSLELMSLLHAYPFPENIRELKAMIHEAIHFHNSGELTEDIFRKRMGANQAQPTKPENSEKLNVSFGPKLPEMNEMKQILIDEALRRTGGNKSRAANMLGISRQAIILREKSKNEGGED